MDVQALALPAAPAHHGEKEAHCAPRLGLPLHTHAVLLGEPKRFLTDRLTRALGGCRGLEQTYACGSEFACECGPPSWSPGSGERALREDLPEVLFPRGLEAECAGCG